MATDGRFATTRGQAVNPVIDLSMEQVIRGLAAEPRDAIVYFARRGEYVKIGCTCKLKARLSALRAHRDPGGGVGPVELLLEIAGGKITEGYFHHRFRESSVDEYGEWFHADADVLGFVTLMLRCQLAAEGDRESLDWIDALLTELRDGLHT